MSLGQSVACLARLRLRLARPEPFGNPSRPPGQSAADNLATPNSGPPDKKTTLAASIDTDDALTFAVDNAISVSKQKVQTTRACLVRSSGLKPRTIGLVPFSRFRMTRAVDIHDTDPAGGAARDTY